MEIRCMRLEKIRALAEYIVQHKPKALGALILLKIIGIVGQMTGTLRNMASIE